MGKMLRGLRRGKQSSEGACYERVGVVMADIDGNWAQNRSRMVFSDLSASGF